MSDIVRRSRTATLRRGKERGGPYELRYADVDGRRFRIDTRTSDAKIADLWKLKTLTVDIEFLAKRMVIESVMSIQSGDNPRIVEHKLSVFIEPKLRPYPPGPAAETAPPPLPPHH